MENASKALLMSAEIVLGVLLLSLLAMVFYAFNNYQSVVEENQYAKVAYEFNAQFEVYEKKEDLNAQDVVSIYNLVQDYKTKVEDESAIQITGISLNNLSTPAAANNFIKLHSQNSYKLNITKRNSVDGKISQIKISQNN